MYTVDLRVGILGRCLIGGQSILDVFNTLCWRVFIVKLLKASKTTKLEFLTYLYRNQSIF